MKRSALWTALPAMVLVLSLVVSSFAVVWADSAGSGGATLSFADGAVTVLVPPAALTQDVDIAYTALTGDAIPGAAPQGTAFGSQVFSLTVSPAVTFSRPVDVTAAYSAEDVATGGGVYTNVNLYTYDVAFKEWIRLDAAIRDIPGNALTTQQTTLGTYALAITGAVAPTPTPPPAEKPKTGDLAPGPGLLLGLLAVGVFLVLGGGYLFLHRPQERRS